MEQEIWYRMEADSVPKKTTMRVDQLEYPSNTMIEDWIRQNLGYVYDWWC